MRWRRTTAENLSPPRAWHAVVGALFLFVLDAYCLNQGVVAGIVLLFLLAGRLPASFSKRLAPIRRQRLRNLSIYATAAVLVFVANHINNRITQARAEDLVIAIESFHTTNGSYPDSLEALVPEFIDHVPRAKFSHSQNRFDYAVVDGEAFLLYVAMPPFGRPTYWFKDHRWSYVD